MSRENEELKKKVCELEKEGFALSANQCCAEDCGIHFEEGTSLFCKHEQENEALKKKLVEAVEVIIEATPIIKDSFWASSPEEDPQYEFKKEFLRHANTARAFLKEDEDE